MSAQLENGYIRIANEIWDEIIRRDFTKRQKDILQFILRLSYGCNRKVAHIPLLKDFALCGVTPNHIKLELDHLKACRVIEWERDDMMFTFNKNYDFWQVSPVKGWNTERFKELVHINLPTSQNGKFPKQEVPKKGSLDFPKREVESDLNPRGSKAEDVSKDSIKDITTTTTKEPSIDAVCRMVFGGNVVPPLVTNYIVELQLKGYQDTFIKELLLETGESSKNPTLRLMQTIGERWIKDKIYSRFQARQEREQQQGTTQQNTYYSRSEKEAATQQRLADERKNEIVEYFVPEFEAGIKEAAAGYDTSTGRSASVL